MFRRKTWHLAWGISAGIVLGSIFHINHDVYGNMMVWFGVVGMFVSLCGEAYAEHQGESDE